jgi:anti-sigma B factor antagonist
MPDLKPTEVTIQERFILVRPQCSELDEPHASDMQEKIQTAREQTPDRAVVLDLSQVRLVPSLSLGALVTLLQSAKQRQQRFILVGLQPAVRETFAVCRLDKLFEIHDTAEAAGKRLQEEPE